MSTVIFPTPQTTRLLGWRGISWGLTKTINTKTSVQTAFTGRDAVMQNWTRPKYDFSLKWNFLRNQRSVAANVTPTAPKEEYRRLHAFFEARRGRYEPFFLSFTTDGDFFTGTDQTIAASAPTPGTDPTNIDSRNYQVVRTFGGTTAPVGGVDVATSVPIVKVNGATKVYNTDYTVNTPKDGYIRFSGGIIAGGELITITCHYYYRVAFKRDAFEAEAFADDFWRVKQVQFESRWW